MAAGERCQKDGHTQANRSAFRDLGPLPQGAGRLTSGRYGTAPDKNGGQREQPARFQLSENIGGTATKAVEADYSTRT